MNWKLKLLHKLLHCFFLTGVLLRKTIVNACCTLFNTICHVVKFCTVEFECELPPFTLLIPVTFIQKG